MSDPNLYPDGGYTFEVDGGLFRCDRGKAHWPALLRLQIPNDHAWNIVMSLLKQIESSGNRLNPEFVELAMSGKITRQDEEGDEIPIGGKA